jgi:hypothetical protein
LGTRREGSSERASHFEENQLIMGRREIRDARAKHRHLEQELEQNQRELLDAVVQESRDAMLRKPHKHGPTALRQRQQSKPKMKTMPTKATVDSTGYGSP